MVRTPIAKIKKQYAPQIMQIQSVVGVGTEHEGEREILKVFVARKTSNVLEKIPKEIEGYAVKIEEVGDTYAQ